MRREAPLRSLRLMSRLRAPEPANVPPPTAADMTLDTPPVAPSRFPVPTPDRANLPKSEAAKSEAAKSDAAKSQLAKEEAGAEPGKSDAPKADHCNIQTRRQQPLRRRRRPPPRLQRLSRRRSPSRPPVMSLPDDQPVADKLREVFGAKAQRYFDRKAERPPRWRSSTPRVIMLRSGRKAAS